MPKIAGNLLKTPLGKNALLKAPHRVWGWVTNKKLKYYSDDHKKQVLSGVFDFDRVNCMITIEEKVFDSNYNFLSNNSARSNMPALDEGPT